MKIKLADLVVRIREVDLPSCCPHCGHYFGDGKGFNLCYLDYVYFKSKPEGDTVTLDYDPSHANIGSEFPCVGVFCDDCGDEVVLGRECVIDGSDLPKVVEHSIWGQALDRVIFKH